MGGNMRGATTREAMEEVFQNIPPRSPLLRSSPTATKCPPPPPTIPQDGFGPLETGAHRHLWSQGATCGTQEVLDCDPADFEGACESPPAGPPPAKRLDQKATPPARGRLSLPPEGGGTQETSQGSAYVAATPPEGAEDGAKRPDTLRTPCGHPVDPPIDTTNGSQSTGREDPSSSGGGCPRVPQARGRAHVGGRSHLVVPSVAPATFMLGVVQFLIPFRLSG